MWKEVERYEGLYWVSVTGEIRNRKGTILRGAKGKSGYLHVVLSKNNTPKTINIHRIVAKAFILNPENLGFVNHIDGNKHNNIVENLEWVTARENTKHATLTGLKNDRGPNSSNSKLNKAQVIDIRELSHRLTNKQIAAKYNISRDYVSLIVNNKRWSHLQNQI